ncbi:PREDICTED: uncharacterized protein LOC105948612 [Erythranthe guttata]|uniref:uncharacterized protein LOC105948612 n=1 Tax=Erythranthe guttata TaxID=4155 RepID=UPI00064DAC91|nr:PREDICTED: uncharacterized protein LOC105948612 [Erythranthe guttata]|eukprot:XP_012827285.1 PREDICTED: uncharacterized protein LOC105948612 [Erythranthe guttata]
MDKKNSLSVWVSGAFIMFGGKALCPLRLWCRGLLLAGFSPFSQSVRAIITSYFLGIMMPAGRRRRRHRGKVQQPEIPRNGGGGGAEGKVGIYVYECKTCSRTFPSFQALGGHRASHKKPKPPAAAADVDRKKPPPAAAPPIDQTAEYTPAPTSTQFPKTHECSICGSEFASGQALGGHMRRHRSAATNTNTTSSSDIIDAGEKTRNMLELDLNLPAPPEDDRRETKFHRFTANKQPRLVFSAAALVLFQKNCSRKFEESCKSIHVGCNYMVIADLVLLRMIRFLKCLQLPPKGNFDS